MVFPVVFAMFSPCFLSTFGGPSLASPTAGCRGTADSRLGWLLQGTAQSHVLWPTAKGWMGGSRFTNCGKTNAIKLAFWVWCCIAPIKMLILGVVY